jgi:hypothetical protein
MFKLEIAVIREMLEAVSNCETSVYQITECNNPEDSYRCSLRRENLTSYHSA